MCKKNNVTNLSLFVAICISLMLPQTASANAGVPMLFVVMPPLALSLIPIIIIETIYLSKRLGLPGADITNMVIVSNLASTLIGIPLTWFVLVALQIFTGGGGGNGIELDTMLGKVLFVALQAAWLVPYEPELHWMIPVAGFVLLVPFFFASWWTEFLVTKRFLKDFDLEELKTSVRNANLITYSLLMFWPLSRLLL